MSQGVNGMAAALAVAGGVLLWSGLRNVKPADTLRTALGRPNAGRPISRPFSDVTSGLGSYVPSGGSGSGSSGGTTGAAGGDLINAVRSKIGAKYVWAATGPDVFDCSGLVIWGLKQIGENPPRFTTATFGSWAKGKGWTRVTRDQLRAGDVVVKAGHMGVMISGDRMIHAPHTGSTVREGDLWAPQTQWWGWRPPGVPSKSKIATEQAELRRIG